MAAIAQIKAEWMPDELAKTCCICKTEFTFFNRKHHCRECGRVCCGTCSDKQLTLLHKSLTGLQRVCNYCYQYHTFKTNFEHSYLPFLAQGGLFQKYGRSGNPHTKYITLTKDKTRIIWKAPDDKDNKEDVTSTIALTEITAIRRGKTTKVFERFVGTSTGKDELCFSLIAQERTLDLEAPNTKTRDEWIDVLHNVLTYVHMPHPDSIGKTDMSRLQTEQQLAEEEEQMRLQAEAKEKEKQERMARAQAIRDKYNK